MFKNLALLRRSSGESPIFLGPMFLHGNNDFECYLDFFSEFSGLIRKTKSPPVMGFDDEGALHGAAAHAVSNSRKLHCIKHLKDNMDKYLKVIRHFLKLDK